MVSSFTAGSAAAGALSAAGGIFGSIMSNFDFARPKRDDPDEIRERVDRRLLNRRREILQQFNFQNTIFSNVIRNRELNRGNDEPTGNDREQV